jgi:hypothetical protein
VASCIADRRIPKFCVTSTGQEVFSCHCRGRAMNPILACQWCNCHRSSTPLGPRRLHFISEPWVVALGAERKTNVLTLEADVANWLGSVQARALEAARRDALPLTEKVVAQEATIDERGGISVNNAVRYQSGFLSNQVRYNQALGAILDKASAILADNLAARFASSPVEWLLRAQLGPLEEVQHSIKSLGAPFSSGPLRHWQVLVTLKRCATEMMKSGSSLGRDTTSWRNTAASRLIEHLRTGVLPVKTSFPVSGIATNRSLTAGNINVRPLHTSELGEIWHKKGRSDGVFHTWREGNERHLITIRSESTVDHFRRGEVGSSDSTVLAFLLQGYPLATSYNAQISSDPVWLFGMTRSHRLGLREEVDWSSHRTLTTANLRLVSQLAASPDLTDLSNIPSQGCAALRRFRLAASREADEDALIDYVVALESLFVPSATEMAYRFKINGALWLGDSYDDRRTLARVLKDLYEARSSRVHGSRSPSKVAKQGLPANLVQEARDLTAEALIRGLKKGWPVDETFFEQLALGGKPQTTRPRPLRTPGVPPRRTADD